jgi:hypothetical protein
MSRKLTVLVGLLISVAAGLPAGAPANDENGVRDLVSRWNHA